MKNQTFICIWNITNNVSEFKYRIFCIYPKFIFGFNFSNVSATFASQQITLSLFVTMNKKCIFCLDLLFPRSYHYRIHHHILFIFSTILYHNHDFFHYHNQIYQLMHRCFIQIYITKEEDQDENQFFVQHYLTPFM